jgi:hypothetical protein
MNCWANHLICQKRQNLRVTTNASPTLELNQGYLKQLDRFVFDENKAFGADIYR